MEEMNFFFCCLKAEYADFIFNFMQYFQFNAAQMSLLN